MRQHAKEDKGRPELGFTIDGEDYPLRERNLTAGELLGYAGKSFGTHYLVELLGQSGQQREYRRALDTVRVHPGSRFLTVSTAPTQVA